MKGPIPFVTLAKEDFSAYDWKKIIDSCKCMGYPQMKMAFQKDATYQQENRNLKNARIAWLLAMACSMMLINNEFSAPFKPFAVMNGRRSWLPEDFLEEDIIFFSKIVETIDHYLLKARVSDLLWLRLKRPNFARMAIEAYAEVPFDPKSFFYQAGENCWKRAIALVYAVFKKDVQLQERLSSDVQAAFYDYTNKPLFALHISKILLSLRLNKAEQLKICRQLTAFAQDFCVKKDFNEAENFFKAAQRYSRKAKLTDDSWIAQYNRAVCIANAANKKIEVEKSYMAARHFWIQAIALLKEIPKSNRTGLFSEKCIDDIQGIITAVTKLMYQNLNRMSTPAIDISRSIYAVKRKLSGRTFSQALYIFLNDMSLLNFNDLKEIVLEGLKRPNINDIFRADVVSSDAMVTAISKPVQFSNTEDAEKSIDVKIALRYKSATNFRVASYVLPALDVFTSEHNVDQIDLATWLKRSPLIPENATALIEAGIRAGFNKNFVLATHLLLPQIECLARYNINRLGGNTRQLNTSSKNDGSGTDSEYSLNKALSMSEAVEAFGEDMVFELKTLLCEHAGANLRNEWAHGLMTIDKCNSYSSIYFWWLMLRLLIKPVLTTKYQ